MEKRRTDFDVATKNLDLEILRIQKIIKEYKKSSSYGTPVYSKERASLKRASMDLTRMLAELRKSSIY